MLTLAPKPIFTPLAQRHFARSVLVLALLTCFAFPLFFLEMDQRALWSSHEGRAAQHAQLMLDTNRWGMPALFFGEADYQKPPLYYWMVALLAKARGGIVDAWSVRFPASAAALLGVWLMVAAGSTFGREWTGGIAGIMVACNLRYSWLARVGRIDMPLMLAVAVVMVCFYGAYRRTLSGSNSSERAGWAWMAGAYISAGIAVMLKGPVGLALPAVPILLFLVWERQLTWSWRRGFGDLLHRFGVWWGVPVVFGIACPWFVWASIVTDGAFFKTFFLHHNWDRTLGIEGLKPEPIWYYIPQLFIDLFPWSILIPAAVWHEVRCPKANGDAFGRFTLCWLLGMFGLLSLVRFKRHDYLLPILPGTALLLAGQWQRLFGVERASREKRWSLVLAAALATTGALLMAGVTVSRMSSIAQSMLESPVLGIWLHDTDRMMLGKLGAAVAGNPAFLLGASVAGAVALVGSWLVYARHSVPSLGAIAAAWFVVFLGYVHGVLPALESLREQRTIASRAREYQPRSAAVYYYGREDQQLMFYLGPNARWLPNRAALRPVITQADPVFVVMELERFEIRQKDWPDVTMIPISRNTDNAFGMHRDPAVLVTNADGWRLVQAHQVMSGLRAN
jgi:4-amino-4-deoxy-L-arabinose transferase-like glycosyltransferase